MFFREIEYVYYFWWKMENSKRKIFMNGFVGLGNGIRIFLEYVYERNGEKISLFINEIDVSLVLSCWLRIGN